MRLELHAVASLMLQKKQWMVISCSLSPRWIVSINLNQMAPQLLHENLPSRAQCAALALMTGRLSPCFYLTSSADGVPKIWVAVLGARGQRGGVTSRIAASQHKDLLPHDVFPSLAFTDGGNIAWRQECIWNSFFLLPKPQFVQFIHP